MVYGVVVNLLGQPLRRVRCVLFVLVALCQYRLSNDFLLLAILVL